ncbi:kinase-like protein [Rhizopogon salebrosus TDB-379]|nr:kinase-like protein [Rhizopogon salebrosus TDB-379]
MSQLEILLHYPGIQAWLNKLLLLFELGSATLQNILSAFFNTSLPDLTGQINKELSRYPVAQGNFGDVWKCTRRAGPSQFVAVKCLRIEIPDDGCKEKVIRRLKHELRQNTQLEHSNLLPLLGTARGFGPLPAIVSPWMNKGSLTMFLERDFQQLAMIQKLQILKDVASALQYLHSKNIVHGDLTGNNILIDEKGNAFVADHGILTICSELSGTSYIRSNVRWAAPENFIIPEDEESASSPQLPSDIYSFGCIMLQVLTGKVPYSECRSDHQVVVLILRGKKPARPVNPYVENSLWDFIQRCWRDAEHRHSAEVVVEFVHNQLEVSEEKS